MTVSFKDIIMENFKHTQRDGSYKLPCTHFVIKDCILQLKTILQIKAEDLKNMEAQYLYYI